MFFTKNTSIDEVSRGTDRKTRKYVKKHTPAIKKYKKQKRWIKKVAKKCRNNARNFQEIDIFKIC